MMRRSCWDIRTCGCDCWLLVSVAHLLLSSARPILPLRKSPGSLFSLPSSLFSSPFSLPLSLPFPLPLSYHPYPRAHCRTRPPSRPGPPRCSHNRFLPVVPDAPFSALYHIIEQAPGFTPEFADYLQAPPAVYRDYTAYKNGNA